MEKAILKTLVYADIFDYPLRVWEIHKWLIGKSASLPQVEKNLNKLKEKKRALSIRGYCYLNNRAAIINKRLKKEKHSKYFLKKAKLVAFLLKTIPWVKLVGISGGLALENCGPKDDIDIFVITQKNRMWICRFFMLGLLFLLGLQRRRSFNKKQAAGKVCLNMILEEDKLQQQKRDLFIAHEVLQMKVLWQRDGIYTKFLADNQWVFKFLPNWTGSLYQSTKTLNTKYIIHNTFANIMEYLARKFQLWYMKKPKGAEKIQEGTLYFHPKDIGEDVLAEYKKNLNKFLAPLDK